MDLGDVFMIKTKKIIKNLILISFCLLFVLVSLPTRVAAMGLVDMSRKGSVEIEYLTDRTMSDIEYRVYKIASISSNGQYKKYGDFENLDIKFDLDTKEKWLELARTLSVRVDDPWQTIEPTKTGRTNKDSIVKFEDLDLGMYLVVGENVTFSYDGQDKKIKYVQSPLLVSIPTISENEWKYDIKIRQTKYEAKDPKLVDRKVLKIWLDNGNKDKRPDSIVVDLLKDGKVHDTVTLSEKNNWRKRWDNLDSKFDWTVLERKVPAGYAVKYAKSGITLEIVNEYTTRVVNTTTEPYVNTTTTKKDTTTKSGETTTSTREGETTTSSNEERTTVSTETTTESLTDITGDDVPRGNETTVPSTTDDEIPDDPIPQAGMLWWPVPVLVCAGVIMFIVGIIRKNKA